MDVQQRVVVMSATWTPRGTAESGRGWGWGWGDRGGWVLCAKSLMAHNGVNCFLAIRSMSYSISAFSCVDQSAVMTSPGDSGASLLHSLILLIFSGMAGGNSTPILCLYHTLAHIHRQSWLLFWKLVKIYIYIGLKIWPPKIVSFQRKAVLCLVFGYRTFEQDTIYLSIYIGWSSDQNIVCVYQRAISIMMSCYLPTWCVI